MKSIKFPIMSYDLPSMRKYLIALLSQSLKKDSKWYKEDYNNIVVATNRKTRKELTEAISTWHAIHKVSQEEIRKHCQF